MNRNLPFISYISLFIVIILGIVLSFKLCINISNSDDKSVETLVDNSAPIISLLRIMNITDSSADIQWLTNELSSGMVEYTMAKEKETADATYIVKEETPANLVKDHIISLKDLYPDQSYLCRIHSQDEFGNNASEEISFTTLQIPGFKKYTNDTMGFSLSYPEILTVEYDKNTDSCYFLTNESNKTCIFGGFIQKHNNTSYTSSKNYVDTVLPGLIKDTSGYKAISTKEITINNTVAFEQQYYDTYKNLTYQTRAIALLKDRTGWFLYFSAMRDCWNLANYEFESMIRSFRIIN